MWKEASGMAILWTLDAIYGNAATTEGEGKRKTLEIILHEISRV